MQKTTLALCLVLFCAGVAQAQNNISWYKCLSGQVGKYGVTLHLHKMGHNFIGYYYYNTEQRPIDFFGNDTAKKGAISLYAYPDDAGDTTQEQFEFTQVDETFTGTWQVNDKLPLIFTAETATGAGIIPFDFIYTFGTKKLLPGRKKSPGAYFEEGTIWPAGSSAIFDTLKSVLYGDSSLRYKNGIGDVLLQHKRRYFEEFAKDTADIDWKDLEKFPQSYDRRAVERKMVVFQSVKLLTIANDTYSYSGGAHGDYGTSYTSINLVAGRRLRLNDVLTPKGQSMLPALLEKHFRSDKKLAAKAALSAGGLIVESIGPNNNFFVTGKGIAFSYTPYEIGPFAMGQITIFIPFNELMPVLQNGFKPLIQ